MALGHSQDPHSGNNVTDGKKVGEFDFGLFDLKIENAEDWEIVELGEKLLEAMTKRLLNENESLGDMFADVVSASSCSDATMSALQTFFALGDYQKVLTAEQITAVVASAMKSVSGKSTEGVPSQLVRLSDSNAQVALFNKYYENPILRVAA